MTPLNELIVISNSYPPPVCPTDLGWLFDLQKNLLTKYKERNSTFEDGPIPWAFDTEAQIYLKQMFGSFEEEIMEFYEQYTLTMNCWLVNDKEGIADMVIYINEEVSDMVHFMFELLILSGITEDDLRLYYNELSNEKHRTYPGGIIDTIFGFAETFTETEFSPNKPKPIQLNLEPTFSRLVMGCRRLDPDYCAELEKHLWQLTYHIKQCLRQLPHKPWKLKQKPVNAEKYQKMLMEVFLHFFNILVFMDISKDTFYHWYLVKNKVNINRIKSGY